MRRLLAFFPLIAALLAGCGARPYEDPLKLERAAPDMNARNWYEIFVYSFRDSDGDGVGDIAGVTEKLGYIEEMGFNGIWLMPVHPSPSYHKYDVTDYYAIDPAYGTMDDFSELVSEAEKRGIRVIMDLVVNHTSDRHPWFQAAKDPASPYRAWYNFSDEAGGGYAPLGAEFYEARFYSGMPDLNLDNEAVREEIKNIMKFWLDKGVSGFRLDAATSYYTGRQTDNIAFLEWLNGAAEAVTPDCYIVGECWDTLGVIKAYYESGVDSFFCFPMSQGDGYIAKALRDAQNPGTRYAEAVEKLTDIPQGVPAPFLDNHDTGRAAGFLGSNDPAAVKFAAGLLAMLPGAVFVYYGDEIGMTGSGDDPNKRIAMFWGDGSETRPPPGAGPVKYAFPSVADQQKDPDSVLNYYKAAFAVRGAFPAIAAGTSERIDAGDGAVCLLKRSNGDETVFLLINAGKDEKFVSLDKAEIGFEKAVTALCADGGKVKVKGAGGFTLPPYSITVLK